MQMSPMYVAPLPTSEWFIGNDAQGARQDLFVKFELNLSVILRHFLGITNLRSPTYSQITPWTTQSWSAAGIPKEENETMKNMKHLLIRMIAEDSGQDLIEYALVAALVGLGAVAAMGTLKNAVATTFNSLTSHH